MSSSPDNLPLNPPEFSREHRLGLVVSGGVSLAIYMNGICQEFYNAVRGKGIYKLIKALTDADIVVDIISGTSAGGINGVLLSYALANSQGDKYINFKEFAAIWKDEGDINKLFFNLKEDRNADKSSFFNGKKYQAQISDALERCNFETAPNDDWFSEFGELDLFITGTDIQGKIYQVFDSTNCIIDVKDHHAIFHLKYRDYDSESNPFNPEDDITREALAKLCRITSCFPVAFPAVTVKLEFTDNNPKPHLDQKLVEWGKLNNRIVPENRPQPQKNKQKNNSNTDDDPGEGYRLHFVDGGVLDNRPFSYTIKEIYHRSADRPVFRKLFYIDPSPERFVGNPKYDDMLKPDIFQVVQDSLLSMPRYESINTDLELINEHNEKVRRYNFLLVDLENLLDKDKPDVQNRDFYDQQRNVYLRTRLISLEDKILPLIFLKSEGLIKAIDPEESRTQKLEEVAKLLAEPFTDPQGSSERLKLLEQLEEEIKNLDVDYALRRYFFITDYVYRLLDENYLCEWLKNKKKQEIDECIKNKEINTDSAESQKKQIDEISIDQIKGILDNIKKLIKELNYHRKLIEIIKDKLDKLFISQGIEKYFFGLLESTNKVPEKQFAEKFYRAMLWLHGEFLDIGLLSNLKNQKLSVKQLTYKLEEKFQEINKYPLFELDAFFKKSSNEQLNQLRELSKKSILQELVNETQNTILTILTPKENVNKTKNTQSTDYLWEMGEIDHSNYIKEKLIMYFKDFEKLDTVLYPLDYLAGTPEKQIIETFRISPEDAKLGFSSRFEKGERVDKKLAGDSLNAFGGFLKESWRANDILWGRLDGFNRIVEALITKDKIKNFEKFLDAQAQAQEPKIAPSEYLDRLLEEALSPDFAPKHKSNSEEDQQYLSKKKNELKQKINNLFSSLDVQSSDGQSLEDEEKSDPLAEFVQSLVSVGHLLILDQEFEETMKTSIEEQLYWKQQKKPQPESPKQKWENAAQNCSEQKSDGKKRKQQQKESIIKFDPINLSFDSAITALVVEEIAKNSLASMSLEDKEIFFNKDYNIGLETWEHLPKPKLKELIDRATYIFLDIFATWQRANGSETRSEKQRSSLSIFWQKQKFIIIRSLLINFTIRVLKDKRFLVLFVSLVLFVLSIANWF
ncbi:patatin-like protein [Allocoleopsis sp.]|uniref:patatin-like protein n=1 Tax=Allocoleopsis sp. TaxID=3088169 RepID=UPI002FD77423